MNDNISLTHQVAIHIQCMRPENDF